MKKIFVPLCIISLSIVACNKASVNQSSSDFATEEQTVVNDFVNNVALGQYSNLTNAAVALNGSVITLNSSTTDANLNAARTAWRNIRNTWEQSEGFLFGPVEDNDYDPNTDTWPTDYTQIDSLLASNNPLEISDIAALPQSLRGYHPLEYVIFGHGEGRTVAELTPRLLKYALNLSADILYNNVQPLYQSWNSAPTNFAEEVLTAGNGSTKFATKQDLFLAINGAMSDICDEVGGGKMLEPFEAKDSGITESPYSNNTLSDFKNNIIGVRNVYLGLNGGTGLKDLVALKNKSLDNQIQSQLNAAINSFDNITVSYEQAIFDQRTLVQQTINQINALKELLDGDLHDFIVTNVKD